MEMESGARFLAFSIALLPLCRIPNESTETENKYSRLNGDVIALVVKLRNETYRSVLVDIMG